MSALPTAAIVTVGTELTAGLRQDTNGGEIARALREAGYVVSSLTSLPDDLEIVAATLGALTSLHALVVVTGGLGPTHDDITREAASHALGRPLVRDASIAELLEASTRRHREPGARAQMARQADVIQGARVLPAVAGTAPGQVVPTPAGSLVLLPGPPNEMRPLLARALEGTTPAARPARLRCIGLTESDAQHLIEPAIAGLNVDFTILASPNDVEAVLFARDDTDGDVDRAASAAREALGAACYSEDGSSLAEVVLRLAREHRVTIAAAESCTGGLIAAALTDVPGSSEVFAGGIVAYANNVKGAVLGVPEGILALHGAVSEQVAAVMAEGVRAATGASLAVSTTGIAGPGGGSDEKPVGLVWLGVAREGHPTVAYERRFGGDRDMVRRRAAASALDLLRRSLLER